MGRVSTFVLMENDELYLGRYRVASTRRPGYDYGQSGAYFVTICTRSRQSYFGEVIVPEAGWDAAYVQPTALGQRALEGWASIPAHAPFAIVDAFVLMPDHVHGLLLFDKPEGTAPPAAYENHFGPQRQNLASVLRGFKSGVTTYARVQGIEFAWQSGFHDRIVRSDDELTRIQAYILTNPSRWEKEWDNGEGLYR